MAFLGFRVPHETSRLFRDIEVPGTKTEMGQYHVTLLYLGNDIEVDVLAEALKATYAVTSKTRHFTVRTSMVMSFPPSPEDGHPVVARITSDELHDLRERLVLAFDEGGIDFNKKYPDYKPHVTLSYAGDAVDEFRIPTIEWGAHELVMWGGDDGDRKLTVTFPLALRSDEKVTAQSLADRYLLRQSP